MWIDSLKTLMPPHPGAGDIVDWGGVEDSWGAEFPLDYKQFVALYGEGGVDGYLSVLLPQPQTGEAHPPLRGMEIETRLAEHVWLEEKGEVAPKIIVWGVDGSGDLLCWRATQDDADEWPVLVWNPDDAQWSDYPCGMVEFLVTIFLADFDECPLGDLRLWGNASPKFLHWPEEQRLRAAGLDPWTGEPDPCAGMFG
ncbi:hypothetical protein G3I31_00555 [Streptomyces sp. SID9913]|uniref:SMI1/KNR4 family protein n=1 Tax=Streptomyces sp. SID9913 TaxID=2706117 RepID=UPI0013DACF95|nr:SMI1/KNR4 family protein [Streptomyces sp. SID9913]NED16684.1 hypothetical protein [Streptomyces sp. SID9913]